MRRRPSARRASVLVASLLAVFFAVAITTLLLKNATESATGVIRARQLSDARRAAANYAEYVAARIRESLDRPEAPLAPSGDQLADMLRVINTSPPSPADFGVDTARYALALRPATCGEVTTARNCLLPRSLNPSRSDLPGAGSRCFFALSIPFSVQLTLTERSTGRAASASVSADVINTKRTFLQYGTYFNGYNPNLSSGVPGKIRGGVFSNNPIRMWTNDTGALGFGAILQIDSIAAKDVNFGKLFNPDNTTFTGIYVSGGDLGAGNKSRARMDGRTTYFADKDSPFRMPRNPYDPATAIADFIPGFITAADLGLTANDSNYYVAAASAGEAHYDPAKYSIIDSQNPNIKDLAARFNGNYKDANTGWEPKYPDLLPKCMQQLPPAELAAAAQVATDPRSIIEPPLKPDAAHTARGSLAQQQEVEAAKFANKSNFYVLIENPGARGTQPLPPVIFNSAELAAKYKAAAAGLSDAAKLTLRASAAYAPGIIVLPASAASAIEVKRSFYDMSQQRAASSDPVKDIRISAVDINLGALKEAIGGATSAPALKMADGSAWNPAAPVGGWNGVVYVDVANPKGNAWVARDKADNPAELTYDTTKTVTNPTIPAGYKYSGGKLIRTADKAPVADPLDRTAEETLIAVRLYNAKEVPDLAGRPGYSGPAGCTLATNTAVYTVGHVNADGVRSTDKANNAADKQYSDPDAPLPEPKSVPFAIACDSLTAFSPAYYRTQMAWDAAYDPTSTRLDGGDWCLRNIRHVQPEPAGFDDKFQEMNFSLIAGGTDSAFCGSYGNGSLYAAAIFNIPVGQTRNGLDTRYRGSRNLLFSSKYNKKYIDGYAHSWENSNDDAYDLGLRESLANVPPGMPYQREYALLNLRIR